MRLRRSLLRAFHFEHQRLALDVDLMLGSTVRRSIVRTLSPVRRAMAGGCHEPDLSALRQC